MVFTYSQNFTEILLELEILKSERPLIVDDTPSLAAHGNILLIDLSKKIIGNLFPKDTKVSDTLAQCAAMLHYAKELRIPATVAAAVEQVALYLPKNGSDTCISILLAMVILLSEIMSEEISEDIGKESAAKDIVMEDLDDSESIHVSMQQLTINMFHHLSSILHKHNENLFHDSSTTIKLLEMCFAVLCSQTPRASLPVVVDFLSDYMSTLITYSNEGYLSDNPTEFFQQLLEFVSSLSEQGISPSQAIRTNLPNLFGPFFGVHNHSVSCKLLEYGYLSVCSQHCKRLLEEGLHHLVQIWKLFPSLDKVRAQERADTAHARTVKICEGIVQDVVMSALEPGYVDEYTAEECVDDELVAMPSAEESQQDQSARIVILLKLLELACAMVGVCIDFLYDTYKPA